MPRHKYSDAWKYFVNFWTSSSVRGVSLTVARAGPKGDKLSDSDSILDIVLVETFSFLISSQESIPQALFELGSVQRGADGKKLRKLLKVLLIRWRLSLRDRQ
jgi:hypothetical protein